MKISIIGLGHLGKIHLKILSELSNERKDFSISGVYDIDNEKLSGISVRKFISVEEAVSNSDTAIIASTTTSHFEIAKLFITSGKHVLIEKPVTHSISTAEELLEIQKKSNVKVQVGHIERFNPAILGISQYNITPLFIESHRLSQFNPRGTDVSVIADLMIHDIDLILNLVKSPVASIDANGASIITDKIDIVNARLKFENGCVANVTASRISQSKMRKMRIFQKNAYISIDFVDNSTEIFSLKSNDETDEGFIEIPLDENKKIIYERIAMESVNPMKEELNSFLDSIFMDTEPLVSLKDGVTALKVADQVLSSITTGNTKIT
ncbi:MAG: Gfo/Idh/MocA family oxidoreductase [Ignavibacteriaceae bacterium]|nr:Gfo/Idh/MocA family oxidoreductase [Ignavibacteriaceae bacterium]